MSFDLKSLVAARMGENYDLHSRHLNPTLVEVLRITGFDKVYVRAEGAYLYDGAGNAYLDFLSGYGVFNMGGITRSLNRRFGTRSTWICLTWCNSIARF